MRDPWWQTIVDSSLEAVVIIDEQGRVEEFNPEAQRMFGWSRSHVLGRPLGPLIMPERLHSAHQNGMDRYVRTGVAHVIGKRLELTGRRADGSEFPLELRVVSLESESGRRFCGFMRDLSELVDARARAAMAEKTCEQRHAARNEFLVELAADLHRRVGELRTAWGTGSRNEVEGAVIQDLAGFVDALSDCAEQTASPMASAVRRMEPAEFLRDADAGPRLQAAVLAPPEIWLERSALELLRRVRDYGLRLGTGELHASIHTAVMEGTPTLTLDLRAHPPLSQGSGSLVLERHLVGMMGGELRVETSPQEVHVAVRVPTHRSAEAQARVELASVRVDEDLVDLVEQFFAEHRANLEGLATELEQGHLDRVQRWSRQLWGSGASYGFPEISELARSVDEACSREQPDAVRGAFDALAAHLRSAKWHVQD